MRKKLVSYVALAVGGVFALNEYHLQRERVALLQTEIGKLREQQDRFAAQPPIVVRAQAAPMAEPALASGAPRPAAERDDRLDPQAVDRQRDDATRSPLAEAEEAFTAESTNDAWATPARAALRDRLTAMAEKSDFTLQGIDCRTSMCRVDVVAKDADVTRQFVDTALTDPNPDNRIWDGPALFSRSPAGSDGSVTVALYLAREGASLSRPERRSR
jgi:hypothetical protein